MRKSLEKFLEKLKSILRALMDSFSLLKLKVKSLWDNRKSLISKIKLARPEGSENIFKLLFKKIKNFKISNLSLKNENLKKISKEDFVQLYEKAKVIGAKFMVVFKSFLSKTRVGRNILNYFNEKSPLEILFLPENRGIVHKSFVVTFSLGLAYFLGKDIALIISPEDDGSNVTAPVVTIGRSLEKKEYEQLSVSNIFSTQDIQLDDLGNSKKVNRNIICNDAQDESRLSIKLINTIVLQNKTKSLASIEITKGKIESFRVGNKVASDARIDRIERLKIYIKNLKTNQCEYMLAKDIFESRKSISVVNPEEGRKLIESKKMDGIENNGNKFVISKSMMNKKMEEIDKILTQARAIQVNNPDGSLSFIITEIEAGSVYSYLGIENNDRILKINGNKIKGLNEVMNLFAGIQQIDHLELTVIKEDGNERNLEYSFSK